MHITRSLTRGMLPWMATLAATPSVTRAQPPWTVAGTAGEDVRSLTMTGSHGLISIQNGMLVYDFSDAAAPEFVGRLDLEPRWPYPEAIGQFEIVIRGHYALVPSYDVGFYVVDLSNWSMPTVVAQTSLPNSGRCIVLYRDYAYVCGSKFVPAYIVDISDVPNPQVVDSFTCLVGGLFDAELVGSKLVAASVNVFVLDLADPLKPIPIDTFLQIGECYALACQANRAYALNWQQHPDLAGLTCYDISDPGASQLLGRLSSEGYEFGLAVRNDRAWIASQQYGLYAADISNPSQPAAVWCYASASPGICTGPQVSYFAKAVTLFDRFAYVSAGSSGLLAFELDPRGDASANGIVNSSDIIHIVSYVFRGGAPPASVVDSDTNCSGEVTSSDVILLVNHVFKGAPAPLCP
jgi:hypothetical protein